MDDIEKLIPDFDHLEGMVVELSALKTRVIVLRQSVSMLEADCIKAALTNSDYWTGPKPPTAAYCTSVVKVIGNTDADKLALIRVREEIADFTGKAELLERVLQLNADRLDLFRSLNADRRKSFLS